MLVLDHSGSMAANDVAPTRLGCGDPRRQHLHRPAAGERPRGRGRLLHDPDTVQQPVTNHAAVRSVIDGQQANGGTDTGPALQLALQMLHGAQRNHPPSAIVLLSDGAANLGISPVTVAGQAHRERIPIYTVALGTPHGVLNEGIYGNAVPVPPDPQLMAEIAHASGGRAYDAHTEEYLRSVYQTLGRSLSTIAQKRDVSVYFLVAAGVLLLVAVLGSVRTAARLP